jgi:RNA polymerase sigma-70 factor (ECF subfamily)
MNETDLIHAALQGNLDSFNELVLKYQDLVFQRAFWILGDTPSADDAAQEAFIKAYHNLSRFRSGSFRAWILRIVTNTCYDELRRRKRSRLISLFQTDQDGDEHDLLNYLVDPVVSIEQTIEQLELQTDLYEQINKLPEAFRQTLLLVDIQEVSYKEAAGVLGVPVGTVKSRLARARLQLRELISNLPEPSSESHFSPSIGMLTLNR